ncbi:MAG: hypothetical protein ABS942_07140 [Solibacillus sp.]
MLNVQTYIYDCSTEEGTFIPLKDYQFTHYEGNFYVYFAVKQNDEVIFETSSELADMLWFILLQIMEQAVVDGQGEWEFPSLLRMEYLEDGQFKLMHNSAEIIYPADVLFPALLDGFEQFMELMDRYFYNSEPTIYEQRVNGYREQAVRLRAYANSKGISIWKLLT